VGKEEVRTPYGEPSGPYTIAEAQGRQMVFLPRHGQEHSIPPHKVNYRANVWGMRELGVERIVGVNAVGGLGIEPGTLVLPEQVIDLTLGGRAGTFYDGPDVVHIDFTEPFCPELREFLAQVAEAQGLRIHLGGTYVCTQGPRLESGAEIQAFRRLGAHLVGMTAMPEAALARELQLCYVSVCVVTNWAAGIKKKRLSTTEVLQMMRQRSRDIQGLVLGLLAHLPGKRGCGCQEALRDARL